MDINFYGVIARLCRYAKPDFMADHKHPLAAARFVFYLKFEMQEISKVWGVAKPLGCGGFRVCG